MILEQIADDKFKHNLINQLSKEIPDEYISSFKDLINYVIDEKLDMFNKPEFMESFYTYYTKIK